ncbi:MAG: universal stress protein [Boseongicola sp.]|nr:universal stress protein [Boseongicola sp.]NNL18432.1 universal stress protein [Boseongicola sp.]
MYKNIAIPVSFDEERDTAAAISVATSLADEGARITFIHVTETVPTFIADYVPPETIKARTEEVKNRLKDLASKVPNGSGVIVHGSAGRAITNWAGENEADCIVVASHRPVVSDILLGSTAAWVVRHADCAVHVVR